MHIVKVTICNFRSIENAEFMLDDYSILLGANNSGKSNVFRALRIFYGQEEFNMDTDFPKNNTSLVSWIEVEFETTELEQSELEAEYQSSDNILKLKRILYPAKKKRPGFDPSKSNLYAYNYKEHRYKYEKENGDPNFFLGEENIAEAKIGDLIYIPDMESATDAFGRGSSSILRDTTDRIIEDMNTPGKNNEFQNFEKNDLQEFAENLKGMKRKGLAPIIEFEKWMNSSNTDQNIEFELDVESTKLQTIAKDFFLPTFIDKTSSDEIGFPVNSLGQGSQRVLLYRLITSLNKYNNKRRQEIKRGEKNEEEFAPNLTLILFEEPEAYLHPSKQVELNGDLKKFANNGQQQVLITTHSPLFVTTNIVHKNAKTGKTLEDMSPLIRVAKVDGNSKIFQIENDELYEKNLHFPNHFGAILNYAFICAPEDVKYDKENIYKKVTGLPINNKNKNKVDKWFAWIAAKLTRKKIVAKLTPKQIVEMLAPEKIAAKLNPKQIVEMLAPEKMAAKLNRKQIAAKLTPEQITAMLTPEQIAEKLTHKQITAMLTPEQIAEKLTHRQITAMLTSEQIDAKLTRKQIAAQKVIEYFANTQKWDIYDANSTEYFRYFLWINAERAAAFFANRVIICEGHTEKICFDHLISTQWTEFQEEHLYILDAGGKYGIHAYINLFEQLGISYSVLIDDDINLKDQTHIDTLINQEINELIKNKCKENQVKYAALKHNFESTLGVITKDQPNSWKPRIALTQLINCFGEDWEESGAIRRKVGNIKKIFESLLPGGGNQYVLYNKNTKTWDVKAEGDKQATSTHSTQTEATKKAEQIAKKQKTDIEIYTMGGKLKDSHSYGNDPNPPKDKK